MQIAVESRRQKLANVEKRWPGAVAIDVTSRGAEPWVRFSPFYPHGGVPIPQTSNATAQSVEGLWQGLKVFEREDIDPGRWAIITMAGIKRGGRSRGAVRGHRFGVNSDVLLGYLEARRRIYLPAYRWVLEHRLAAEADELRRLAAAGPLVLLDYETNADVEDTSRPLSHAALIRCYLQGEWPAAASTALLPAVSD